MSKKAKSDTIGDFDLKVGDYVIVEIDEPVTLAGPEYIIGAKIKSGTIKIVDLTNSSDKITNKYKDYHVGIIFDKGWPGESGKGKFIPAETSLRIFQKGHYKCQPNCSAYIRQRKSAKVKIRGQDRFKICTSDEDASKLKSIKMVALVDTIDESGKFMDLTIGPVYSLMKKC